MGALQTKKMEPRGRGEQSGRSPGCPRPKMEQAGEKRDRGALGALQTKTGAQAGAQRWSTLQTKKTEPRLPGYLAPVGGRCLHP